ncbi:MAG: hypothetical protein KGL90_11335 [Burkholderiales bacterium]|nr:hypothetical protein [Burkholderiales bacterium]
MNNVVEDFADKAKWVARIVAKRRWLVLFVASGLALISGVFIAAVPDRYRASATVYVDTDTVLKPLMSGITFQPDVDQQVRVLARTLISRPNVERLVGLPQLHFQALTASAHEELVARLMTEIMVVPTASDNLYQITYRGPSPERAKSVVDETVQMFVHSGLGAKKRDSREAGRFIEDQIKLYEGKLVDAESRLKEFKARNFGVSGTSNQDYFTRVSVLTDEVGKLRIALIAAEKSRDSYARELAATDPHDEARLDAQKKHLDELLSSYTEAHPEVISTRRVIATLEAEAQARKTAGTRVWDQPGKTATSPVYQRLRLSLADTEAQVASLRSQLAAQQERLDQVRALASRVPGVEADLAQLNRDYEVIRKNYDLMVARREAASLGVKLDESSRFTEFKLVEPTRVSRTPIFPSRLHLALMAAVATLAVGVAAAIVADLMWPTFDETSSLRMFSKRPVLGSVPTLLTIHDKRAQRMSAYRFMAASAALVTMQAMWLAWVTSH